MNLCSIYLLINASSSLYMTSQLNASAEEGHRMQLDGFTSYYLLFPGSRMNLEAQHIFTSSEHISHVCSFQPASEGFTCALKVNKCLIMYH